MTGTSTPTRCSISTIARMVGGGFGGSAIALVAQAQIEEIKGAIADAFTSASFTQPRFFTSLPSAGAQIVKKLDR